MLSKFKYYIILFLGLIIGAIVLQSLLNSYYESEKQQQMDRLSKVQSDAVLRVETGINIYATIISSIRAFVQNADSLPTEQEFQLFINDLLKEVSFKDSIVVSYIDTSQIFKYVVTPHQIDPYNLKGVDVKTLRPDFEIEKLNKLMYEPNISLFDPINLKEGWAAFPFNFSAKNKKGKVLGYIAPVLNVKYLLDYTYRGGHDSLFAHRFITGNNFDFTREAVYDGTTIYNQKSDDEYYKNFNINPNDFIYTDVSFYGLNLKIGSAYKYPPKSIKTIAIVTYIWFAVLVGLCIITLFQFLKNNRLNALIKTAHKDIAIKNQELENNLLKIQTLIKEIHHRVKNNMQIISSLLTLQRNDQTDKNVIAALDESKRRIESMALVHQKLYGTHDLSHINVGEYIEQLIGSIEYTLHDTSITTSKKINIPKDLFFNIDRMIPLGLILNELVTNSFKYAFIKNGTNSISISITSTGIFYQLVYSDSGKGIPEHIDFKNSGTLGLELIHVLAEQLDGTVEYNNEPTSTFTIQFKTELN